MKNSNSQLLQEALGRLKMQNPQLSIRALARQCHLSPSYLSKLIRGDKNIPAKLVDQLSTVFKLDILEAREMQKRVLEFYEDRNLSKKTGFKIIRDESQSLDSYKKLTKDDLWILEKWYYIPILNWISLGDQCAEAKVISQKFNVSLTDVETTLRLLEKHQFIVWDESHKTYRRSEAKVRFPTKKSHPQVRDYHRQMIKKALTELSKTDQQSFDRRLIAGLSMTADPKKVPEAMAILNKAIYEAAELLMNGDEASEVYQINIQFFAMTR